jgi:hypothetical protein
MNPLKNCPTLEWKHKINIFIHNAYKKKLFLKTLNKSLRPQYCFFHSFLFKYNKFIK